MGIPYVFASSQCTCRVLRVRVSYIPSEVQRVQGKFGLPEEIFITDGYAYRIGQFRRSEFEFVGSTMHQKQAFLFQPYTVRARVCVSVPVC